MIKFWIMKMSVLDSAINIDLSTNGRQPMFLNDRYLCFQWEIYNYIELKRLDFKDYSFALILNEVILAAYDRGARTVLVNGMGI